MDFLAEIAKNGLSVGLVVAALGAVIVYLQKKSDKKDEVIAELYRQLLAESKAHAADYRELAKDNAEIMQGNSQNMQILSAKIEVAKGKR